MTHESTIDIALTPIENLVRAIRTEELVLPAWQRTLVWREEQKRELINALLRRHPIGSLLKARSDSSQKWLLVDGLQRSQAILDFFKEPLVRLRAESSLFEATERLLNALLAGTGEHIVVPERFAARVSEVINGWLEATKITDAAAGFDASVLAPRIAEAARADSLDLRSELVAAAAREFIDHIRGMVQIGGQVLPVISFTGNQSEMAEIFENMNSRGTPLTRYDILAAAWNDVEVAPVSKEIRRYPESKWAYLEEQGFSITADEPTDGEDGPISLHSYLAGLGDVLSRSHQLLFPRRDLDRLETPRVGFLIAAMAHQVRLFPDLRPLSSAMRGSSAEPIDPSLFEAVIKESASFVEGVLKPVLSLRLNRQRSGVDVPHSEYQAVAYLCAALQARYASPSWEELPDWETRREALWRALPAHYLKETLSGIWGSAGDTLLFRRLWVAEAEGDAPLEPAHHYESALDDAQIVEALDTWFKEAQLSKRQKKRAPVSPADKLFLRFAYAGTVSSLENQAVTFELEHLFPVARLAPLASSSSDGGWAIGAVSNLALFDKPLNRSKKTKTIAEHIRSKSGAEQETLIAQCDRWLLMAPGSWEQVSIPQRQVGGRRQDALTRSAYEAFLRSRFAGMRDKVLAGLRVLQHRAPHGSERPARQADSVGGTTR